jgi:hypothetical protein
MVITSKWAQRLLGLILLSFGAGFTVWCWSIALNEGTYHREAVAFFPASAVVGLGLIFFPIDREQLRAEHGVDKPTTFAHYPIAWKVLIFVGVAAGVANWVAVSQCSTRQGSAASVTVDRVKHSTEWLPNGERATTESISGRVESRGVMHELWFWIKLGLLLGGAVIGLVGMMWVKTAELVRYFGVETRPNRGLWVMMSGAAMLGIGLALNYFGL